MECVDCDGKECEQCNGSGTIDITECPLLIVTDDVWETIEYADLYKKGLPPIAGGALDQTQNFLEAARVVFAEQSYWKNKLGRIS